MANVIKDIGQIWTRLFDHRPFLNGEIKFFIQEFEEKRGTQEVDKLFEILQNLTEIRYSQIDKIKLAAETNLLTLKKKLDKSTEICHNILDKESNYKKDSILGKNKELRKTEWDLFTQELEQKCEKVNKSFNQRENDLYNYYTNLEKQLIIPLKHSS